MKLRQYAKRAGVTYKTAWRWYKADPDPTIGTIIVEHKDRLTRFGFQYIRQLLEVQNRGIEVIFETATNDELVDGFAVVMTSMAARLYGRRHAKQRALCIQQWLSQCLAEKL